MPAGVVSNLCAVELENSLAEQVNFMHAIRANIEESKKGNGIKLAA